MWPGFGFKVTNAAVVLEAFQISWICNLLEAFHLVNHLKDGPTDVLQGAGPKHVMFHEDGDRMIVSDETTIRGGLPSFLKKNLLEDLTHKNGFMSTLPQKQGRPLVSDWPSW